MICLKKFKTQIGGKIQMSPRPLASCSAVYNRKKCFSLAHGDWRFVFYKKSNWILKSTICEFYGQLTYIMLLSCAMFSTFFLLWSEKTLKQATDHGFWKKPWGCVVIQLECSDFSWKCLLQAGWPDGIDENAQKALENANLLPESWVTRFNW